jgi:hypothetical protein
MRQLLGVTTAKRQGGAAVVFVGKSHYTEFVAEVDGGIVGVVVIATRASIVVVAHGRPP